MTGHEKKRLPRGVELEKRRYIGFAKQPVGDTSRVMVTDLYASSDYPLHCRPWVDGNRRKDSQ